MTRADHVSGRRIAFHAPALRLYRGLREAGAPFPGMQTMDGSRIFVAPFTQTITLDPTSGADDTRGLSVLEVKDYDRERNTAPGDDDLDEYEDAGVDVLVYQDESPDGREHETIRLVSPRAVAALTRRKKQR